MSLRVTQGRQRFVYGDPPQLVIQQSLLDPLRVRGPLQAVEIILNDGSLAKQLGIPTLR